MFHLRVDGLDITYIRYKFSKQNLIQEIRQETWEGEGCVVFSGLNWLI